MRILHVIAAVAPRYGGPSTAIWPLVAALRQVCGFTVEVATTDADGPERTLTAAQLPEHAVYLFKRDCGETYKHSRSLGRWLAAHARDYDVIQAHGHWSFPTAAACRAARRAGVPYLLRPCGMLSDYSWRRSWLKKRLYWWLVERANVYRAAAFHVTSRAEQQEVRRLGVRVPAEVIPLGIAEAAWSTPAEPCWLRQQCPQAGDRPLVLFLSRLHPKKGLTDLLLPALTMMKTGAFLVIAGGEDSQVPGYAAQIRAAMDRHQLGDRAALLGPVAPERRWAAYDGAALFVLPSHSENFGQVVIEAMARGLPVVISSGVQVAEHVTAAGAGTVVPPDAGSLAGALDTWLADPPARSAAGALGRRYVRDTFSWQRSAERLGKLYRQIRADRR